MKIKFTNPEQVELVAQAGSKNRETAMQAQEALAAFIQPIAFKVLSVAGTSNKLYTDLSYNEDDSPSIPLDLYYNEKVGYITVWSQSIAGGLPTNVTTGIDELKIATYRLDSAASVLKKYARRHRLDVVSKTISKMLNEVLIKQERNAWSVILKALAEARTNTLEHVIDATADNIFQLDDLNRLMTRIRRINTAFDGSSTNDIDSKGLTDLFVSPEIVEQIRAFAYQPMNTRGVPNSDESTAVPLPDSIRQQVFRSAGAQEIYGVSITEMLELGDNEKYNRLFDNFYSGAVTMAHGTDQILVGADLSRECLLRPIAKNADSGSSFEVLPDDQYLTRQDKMGWYGSLEEGRICIDSRGLCGIVV